MKCTPQIAEKATKKTSKKLLNEIVQCHQDVNINVIKELLHWKYKSWNYRSTTWINISSSLYRNRTSHVNISSQFKFLNLDPCSISNLVIKSTFPRFPFPQDLHSKHRKKLVWLVQLFIIEARCIIIHSLQAPYSKQTEVTQTKNPALLRLYTPIVIP